MRLTEARIRRIVRGILRESSPGDAQQPSRLATMIDTLCDSTARNLLKQHPEISQKLEPHRGTIVILPEMRLDEMIRNDPTYPSIARAVIPLLKRLTREILDEVSPNIFPRVEGEIDALVDAPDAFDPDGEPIITPGTVNVATAVENSLFRTFEIASVPPSFHLARSLLYAILPTFVPGGPLHDMAPQVEKEIRAVAKRLTHSRS